MTKFIDPITFWLKYIGADEFATGAIFCLLFKISGFKSTVALPNKFFLLPYAPQIYKANVPLLRYLKKNSSYVILKLNYDCRLQLRPWTGLVVSVLWL